MGGGEGERRGGGGGRGQGVGEGGSSGGGDRAQRPRVEGDRMWREAGKAERDSPQEGKGQRRGRAKPCGGCRECEHQAGHRSSCSSRAGEGREGKGGEAAKGQPRDGVEVGKGSRWLREVGPLHEAGGGGLGSKAGAAGKTWGGISAHQTESAAVLVSELEGSVQPQRCRNATVGTDGDDDSEKLPTAGRPRPASAPPVPS